MKHLCLFILLLSTVPAFADGERDKLRTLQQQEAVRRGEMTNTRAQEMRQQEDSLRKQRWQNRQDKDSPAPAAESRDNNRWREQWKKGPRSQD